MANTVKSLTDNILSGKSTLCHKVLMEHGVRYGYVNFDDDRLTTVSTEDLNKLLECLYRLYGTDIPFSFVKRRLIVFEKSFENTIYSPTSLLGCPPFIIFVPSD